MKEENRIDFKWKAQRRKALSEKLSKKKELFNLHPQNSYHTRHRRLPQYNCLRCRIWTRAQCWSVITWFYLHFGELNFVYIQVFCCSFIPYCCHRTPGPEKWKQYGKKVSKTSIRYQKTTQKAASKKKKKFYSYYIKSPWNDAYTHETSRWSKLCVFFSVACSCHVLYHTLVVSSALAFVRCLYGKL